MHLHAEHQFPGFAPEDVAAAMVDPDFAVTLADLPDVGEVGVVDSGADGTTRWLTVRMVYGGSLDPVAARVLGSSSPSWIQTYRLAADASAGSLTITPEHHESLLRCWAELTFTDLTTDPGPTSGPGAPGGPGGTRRSMRGELSVRVPLLGGRAEKALAPAITSRIDVEAELLRAWLG